MDIRKLKEQVDASSSVAEIYDIMLEVNSKLQEEYIYLSENRGIFDSGQEAEVQGNIAMLTTVRNYANDKIEELKRNVERAHRINYNVKVLLRAAVPDDKFKQIVDMAYNLSTKECKEAGERIKALLV
jgi:hypothetical protein